MILVRTVLSKYFSIESSFSYSENSVYLLQFLEEKENDPYFLGYVILVFSKGEVVDCTAIYDDYKAGLEYFNTVLDLSEYTGGWILRFDHELSVKLDAFDDFFAQHLNYLGIDHILFECKEDDLHACNTLRLCQV